MSELTPERVKELEAAVRDLVERQPNVPESYHRTAARSVMSRQWADADEARTAANTGTSVVALRRVRAEAKGREAERRDRDDDAAARLAIGEPPTRSLARRDPRQMVSAEDVARERSRLEDSGKPSGERSIATELGVSRDAVRYAEGKDRYRPRT